MNRVMNRLYGALIVLACALGCGAPNDASDPDAGGLVDAGQSDTGAADVGQPEAGTTDAGTTDAGTTDAGTTDAGTPDARRKDAGTKDAGTKHTTTVGYYYPPLKNDDWQTTPAASAGFDTKKLVAFINYVGQNNSTALIILHRGKVVTETYWQKWTPHTSEPMFSATKSLTSVLIGIALEQKKLTLTQTVSSIIGAGWSGASKAQEAAITVRHLLTMTSGLADKKTLKFVAAVGGKWDYNTKAYYVLGDILQKVTGSRTSYTEKMFFSKIGMRDSAWVNLFLGTIKTMKSSARDMARFGLLVLSNGTWDGKQVVSSSYLATATQSSQQLNPSYGYLFWLNGKSSYMLPKRPKKLGSMFPAAPKDMVSALGAKDKKIYIVPSLDLVVVRHGDTAKEGGLAGSTFDNELWKRLSAALK